MVAHPEDVRRQSDGKIVAVCVGEWGSDQRELGADQDINSDANGHVPNGLCWSLGASNH